MSWCKSHDVSGTAGLSSEGLCLVFSEESRLAVPAAHSVTELENPTAPHRMLAHCAEL